MLNPVITDCGTAQNQPKEDCKMSKNNPPEMGQKQVKGLGKTALGMIAVGLTSGIALIAAAKKLGDVITDADEETKDGRADE